MSSEVTLPYNGLMLDRAGYRRADPEWIEQARAHGRAVAFWRDRCLVRAGAPVVVPAAGESVFLGMDSEAGVFATDLSEMDEAGAVIAVGADATVDVRRLYPSLAGSEAAILSYARGILHWNRNQRFCGACGGRATSRDAGHLRVCDGCGKLLFPRIEPAVIVLVEAPDPPARCLLARHQGSAPDVFSTLAGFVEIGESLEGAVRRELAEEAGVRVGEMRYQASQSWPFPAGLMIGFRAIAVSDSVAVDRNELAEARWFTRDEVVARLATGENRTDSIERPRAEREIRFCLVMSWVQGV